MPRKKLLKDHEIADVLENMDDVLSDEEDAEFFVQFDEEECETKIDEASDQSLTNENNNIDVPPAASVSNDDIDIPDEPPHVNMDPSNDTECDEQISRNIVDSITAHEPARRLVTKHRKVNSIDSSLDIDNYKPVILPKDENTYSVTFSK